MKGDSDADTDLLNKMAEEAKVFIQAFDWCKGIKEAYFGCGIGSVVGVFFFSIVPASEEVDDCLWAIVGDLPPAYLVTDESRTPSEACELMSPKCDSGLPRLNPGNRSMNSFQ